MSLIKCPECGKMVSDQSEICIGCGFPIGKHFESMREAERKNEEHKVFLKKLNEEENKYASMKDKRDVEICTKDYTIQIFGMDLLIKGPLLPDIKDKIWNFSLEYFAISMGINAGFMINNPSKNYSTGVRDIACIGEIKNKLILFKDIMENNGLYVGRSRIDVLYKRTDEELDMQIKTSKAYRDKTINRNPSEEFHGIYRYVGKEKIEVFCPRCHSQNCSYYTTQNVIPEKVKTKYTANLNPFKPFTLVNKKDKVIRKEKVVTDRKIICNDCGHIFG